MNIIWLQITSLVYMSILLIIYFSTKRLESIETSIFKKIMIANEIGLFIELSCFFTVSHIDTIPIINSIVTHLLLIYYLLYILLFTIYLFFVVKPNEKSEKYKKNVNLFCFIYFLINVVLIICLPMKYHIENNKMYSYGPDVNPV